MFGGKMLVLNNFFKVYVWQYSMSIKFEKHYEFVQIMKILVFFFFFLQKFTTSDQTEELEHFIGI